MRSRPSTPKQERATNSMYRYYAGFSEAFVADIIDHYVPSNARVVDPWNGSGTTTSVCADRGIDSVGLDINPGAVAIAWSRCARRDLIHKLCDWIRAATMTDLFPQGLSEQANDLATVYLSERSATAIHGLRHALIHAAAETAREAACELETRALSGTAFALLSQLVALALRPLRGTNPSWFMRPRTPDDRVDPTVPQLRTSLDGLVAALSESALASPGRPDKFRWPQLLVGDARHDLSKLGSFDVAITSPPYCTRIDYAIATIPELIALGEFDQGGFARLRSVMMGAVVTNKQYASVCDFGGTLVGKTLNAIRSHHTKAAGTYYSRYFSRYFDDLLLSLDQLAVGVSSGITVFTLQNSFFKEVRIDLVGIVEEHMSARGFHTICREEYPSRSPIAGSNPKYRRYRNSNVSSETVLIMANS